MDIYSFINSKDIAEHCKNIGHEFTPLEQAVIIYKSKKTLSERHKAWKNIIEAQPDMKVIEWTEAKVEHIYHNSLHKFLIDYMRIENILANKFKIKEPDAIYTYSVRYNSEVDGEYHHNNTPRSTYDMVIKAIKDAAPKVLTEKEKCDNIIELLRKRRS